MSVVSLESPQVRSLFIDQAQDFLAMCQRYTDLALLDPSLHRAWTRLDLIVHVRAMLNELAACIGVPSQAPVDCDLTQYWTNKADTGEDEMVSHAMWLRRTASTYGWPRAALDHLADATARVCGMVERAPDHCVEFQGRTMQLNDLLAAWVVELSLHQWELNPDHRPPGAALTCRTLEVITNARGPMYFSNGDEVVASYARALTRQQAPMVIDLTDPTPTQDLPVIRASAVSR